MQVALRWEKQIPKIVRIYIIKKVKISRNRLCVVQRVPGGLGAQISMTFGT